MNCRREPTEQEIRDLQREANEQFLADLKREQDFKEFLKWKQKRLKKPRHRDLKKAKK